jgi:hypothetical protein
MYINSCDPGLVCLSAEAIDSPNCQGATGCCGIICDITDPPDCPGAAEECISYYEQGQAPPQYMNVGVCVIPN